MPRIETEHLVDTLKRLGNGQRYSDVTSDVHLFAEKFYTCDPSLKASQALSESPKLQLITLHYERPSRKSEAISDKTPPLSNMAFQTLSNRAIIGQHVLLQLHGPKNEAQNLAGRQLSEEVTGPLWWPRGCSIIWNQFP